MYFDSELIAFFTGEYTMEFCEICDRPLTGGELTLPWEDGNNRYAYVTCPHCGCRNVQYGYGEDED